MKTEKSFCFLFLSGLCLSVLFQACGNGNNTPDYEFTAITRGTIEKTVSSTGTLNPVATVKVLPRMSGKVEIVYADFNAPVSRGDVLAELNTDVLQLKLEQQLAQVFKARANYELELINHENLEVLAEKNLVSEYELKASRTNLEIQRSELAAAEANLRSIETEINQYAFITSPIDGIVLERNINVGDTVVDSSSANSSAIFTLAENLEEMRIESWVGELDISSIREGQEVRFTLESLPGRTYGGTVESKRLMPQVQDNVVSYEVIISVSNRDGSLLPGMTCYLEFIEERNENILLVPNAALRYQPANLSAGEIDDIVFNATLAGLDETGRAELVRAREEAKAAASVSGNENSQTGLAGLMMPMSGNRGMRFPRGGSDTQGQTMPQTVSAPKPLWFIDSAGKLDVILVQTGISDGSRTEVYARSFSPSSGGSAGQGNPGVPSEMAENAFPALEGMRIIVRERVQ